MCLLLPLTPLFWSIVVNGSVSIIVLCIPSIVLCVPWWHVLDIHFTYEVYIDGLNPFYCKNLSPLYIVFCGLFASHCLAIAVVEFECIYGVENCLALFTLIQEVHLLE